MPSDFRSSDERDLVAACLDGNDEAWSEIVRRYADLIFSIPRRYGLDSTECDDIFQTVLATMVARLESLRDVQSLPKWVMTTTQRECWRVMRRRRSGPALDEAWVQSDEGHSERLALGRWEEIRAVREALGGLDERCAKLLLMLFAGSTRPDYQAISAAMDMPVGSIGPNRARCLKRLVSILEAQPGGQEILDRVAREFGPE